jgi:hypothetical protein
MKKNQKGNTELVHSSNRRQTGRQQRVSQPQKLAGTTENLAGIPARSGCAGEVANRWTDIDQVIQK